MSDRSQEQLSEAREKLASDIQRIVSEAEPTSASESLGEAETTLPVAEMSEIEKQASSMGWKPSTDYTGDKFVTAEEYVKRAPLFERIEKQSKEVKELRELVKHSTQHIANIKKESYERALRDLEASKTQQIEIGNVQGVQQADIQLNNVKQQMFNDPVVNVAPIEPMVLPEVAEFGQKNKHWYNNETTENKKMMAAATAIDHFLYKQAEIDGVTINPKQHLQAIEAEVTRLFPHRFENTKKDEPAMVGKSNSGSKDSKSSSLVGRLTAQQKEIGLKFHRSNPAYTLEQYAQDLGDRLGK